MFALRARPALTCAGILALLIASCHSLRPRGDEQACPESAFLEKPRISGEPSMMALAHDLDKVEKYIDWYGSVVPKVPDVWGQARLTQHREEFEAEMKSDLSKFGVVLNGAITRADDAFFAQATALGIAAQPRPRLVTTGSRNTVTEDKANWNTTIQNVTHTGSQTDRIEKKTELKAPEEVKPPAAVILSAVPATGSDKPQAIAILPTPNTTALINDTNFGKLRTDGIGLEPTIVLEQKARYLNLLNQIRRTNEGDDTADSPGYSLNLMRIPVSLLPGKKTDVGYGAEVTFSLSPVLSDELLPMTFRSLVINDLIDHVGLPLVKYLESDEGKKSLSPAEHLKLQELHHNEDFLQYFADGVEIKDDLYMPFDKGTAQLYRMEINKRVQRLVVPSLAPAKGLQARTPFPNSQIIDVYGIEFAHEVAFQAFHALQKEVTTHNYAHLPDVQSFLQSELNAAYRYLAEPSNAELWNFCSPDLVRAIRNRNAPQLARMRAEFRTHFRKTSESMEGPRKVDTEPERRQFSVTAALAWAILVDSALLTDRLLLDMKETAAAKNCPPLCSGAVDFFLPNPSVGARQAFNEYVKCRWPIHVFALDPMTQDQNLADALSTRRETQLALSIAFVNGTINANQMTRYARKLEAQYETVALNRTQVGFSHGESTFGWRFYPRFQTPDTSSNLEVLVRDQLIGGPNRNALLRERRLEPGPRECVAIVLMPSFVPYVTCDSVSNWFGLANPKHKEFDHSEAMRISRAIKTLQRTGPTVTDADRFRDGDFRLLQRRVDQLETRLPTQTMTVPVPIMNTLGGFEMFNNGTTDLAPDLYGFYGAPGIVADKETTLFLVGDHFSPLRTEVIVGNLACSKRMLSRQVVQVTVPRGTLAASDGFVHAHVATPYGVTREIRIPVAGAVKPLANANVEAYALDPSKVIVRYWQVPAKDGKFTLKFRDVRTEQVAVLWQDALGTGAAELGLTFHYDRPDGAPLVLPLPTAQGAQAIRVKALKGELIITNEQLKELAEQLIETLNGKGAFTAETNPLANPIKTKEIGIWPVDGTRLTQRKRSANQLEFEFQGATTAPGGPPPAAIGQPVKIRE